jgi:heptosyltransferase-2
LAETWPSTRGRRALLKVADVIGRAAIAPFRRERQDSGSHSPRRILVIEPWNIGDVVLATPLLRALRERYPKARISLLGKQHAQVILEESGLVDEVIIADLPWTASRNKYPLKAANLQRLRGLVRRLRAANFDVTVDARMDIRSNLLAALTKAPHRIGYAIGGGGWLLTRSLPANRRESHKIDDWLDLLPLLPGSGDERDPVGRLPHLAVSEEERARAAGSLRSATRRSSPVIGYHPGGSHAAKRWPLTYFEKLIRELDDMIDGSHIVFLGPADTEPEDVPNVAVVRRGSLRDLMVEIASCDVLVCNDSGPMHLADALGVPVVAIFEIGNPQWYGPSGPRATVIVGELAGLGMSAAPLDRAPIHPVPVERVKAAVIATLSLSQNSFAVSER